MAHGSRRRLVDEFTIETEPETERDVIEAFIAETLDVVSSSDDVPVEPKSDRYHRYPKYADDQEAEDARLARPWDPDDSLVQRLMQPGDPDEAPPRGSGRSSGGGKSRKKPVKIVVSTGKGNASDVSADEDLDIVRKRIGVYGLTPWELRFYTEDRPDAHGGRSRDESGSATARGVLIKVAARLKSGALAITPTFRKRRRFAGKRFYVYGLTLEQWETLRRVKGTVCTALAAYAHQHDHDRIVANDNDLFRKWAEDDVRAGWKLEMRAPEDEGESVDAFLREVGARQRELEREPLDNAADFC